MSGLAGALGAFAEGLGNSIQSRRDREERKRQAEMMDRYISAIQGMGSGPGMGVPPAGMGAGAPGGTADPNVSWLRYANSGATRSMPVSAQLIDAMGFLPEIGVQMEVFSGGQPAKGTSDKRVGSTRHDHGHAADVFFVKDGRRLDWSNPSDLPIFQDIVRRAKGRGVTGFGAGPGYMQPGSMHIGFGAPAVWGAGGKGANAPDWLREAYGGPAPAPARTAAKQQPKKSLLDLWPRAMGIGPT